MCREGVYGGCVGMVRRVWCCPQGLEFRERERPEILVGLYSVLKTYKYQGWKLIEFSQITLLIKMHIKSSVEYKFLNCPFAICNHCHCYCGVLCLCVLSSSCESERVQKWRMKSESIFEMVEREGAGGWDSGPLCGQG